MGHWHEAWGPEIRSLTGGVGLLSLENEAIARLVGERPEARYKSDRVAFIERAEEFVRSLLDVRRDADDALMWLRSLSSLFRGDLQSQASKFPQQAYNELLGIVNAKRIWLLGDTSLRPGPGPAGIQARNEEPDYAIAGESLDEEIGDHVRVSTGNTLPELQQQIADRIAGKLRTYPQRNVRVVLDVDPQRARLLGVAPNTIDADLLAAVLLVPREERARLTGVEIVVGSAVHGFVPTDYP